MLTDIGGVDYLGREPRFDVVYHLLKLAPAGAAEWSLRRARAVRRSAKLRSRLPSVRRCLAVGKLARARSSSICSACVFSGHRICGAFKCPYEWEGHPLRKDYPLRGPARERTPRPSFALKSNVAAGTPAAGKTAAALQRQIAAARGQVAANPAPEATAAAQAGTTPGAVPTAGAASPSELAAERNAARGGQLPKDGSK